MISKNQIQHIRSLHQKKIRQEARLFIAEGEKVVIELFQSDYRIDSLFATKEWINNHEEFLTGKDLQLFEISNKDLERISTLSTPQPVIAIAEIKKPILDFELIKSELILILDDINDPGNLGAIIRNADWFDVKTIVCSATTVDHYNPKVIQSAMGSAFRVTLHYLELENFISDYKSKTANTVYGANLNGKDVYHAHLHLKGALIMGSESHGISEKIEILSDEKLTIPSFQTAATGAESLNAAVASGILLSEFRRRIDRPF